MNNDTGSTIMASQQINLFQTKASPFPILLVLERYVKPVSLIVAGAVCTLGLLAGIALFFVQKQKETLTREQGNLVAVVKDNTAKESLLIMLRQRLGTIDAIVAKQVSYAPYITTTMNIIQSIPLTSFSMGDNNMVTISVRVGGLGEATAVLRTLLEMEKKKEIANPVLKSFDWQKDGILLTVSYAVLM